MLTVQTIVNICAQAEQVFDHRYHFDLLMEQSLHTDAELGASPTGARQLRPYLNPTRPISYLTSSRKSITKA